MPNRKRDPATGKDSGTKIRGSTGIPLLLSVRSGATLSLPGMMQSILNVGINEKIAEGLSKKTELCLGGLGFFSEVSPELWDVTWT